MFTFTMDENGNLIIADHGADMSIIYTAIPHKDVIKLKKLLESVPS